MTRAALVAAAGARAARARGAGAATPRASLPDIEDEVMCLECGTALNVSTSAVADQERAFIRQLIAEGKTKEQIKAALVARVRPARPRRAGGAAASTLTAWLVPDPRRRSAALALVVGLARRWRRPRGRRPERRTPARRAAALDPADARRLDAELAAFDR